MATVSLSLSLSPVFKWKPIVDLMVSTSPVPTDIVARRRLHQQLRCIAPTKTLPFSTLRRRTPYGTLPPHPPRHMWNRPGETLPARRAPPLFVSLTGATPPRIATPLNAPHPVLRPPHGWNPPAPHPYRELPGGTDTSQHVTDTSPFFPDSPCWCLTRGFSRNPLKSWDRRVLALAV